MDAGNLKPKGDEPCRFVGGRVAQHSVVAPSFFYLENSTKAERLDAILTFIRGA